MSQSKKPNEDLCDHDYKDWVNYSHSAAELQAVADKISRKPLNGMNMLKQYAATPEV